MNNTKASSILPSRPIHPHISTSCTNPSCKVPLEYPIPIPPPPTTGSPLQVRCYACQTVFTTFFSSPNTTTTTASSTTSSAPTPNPPPSSSSPSTSTSPPPHHHQRKKNRLIGSQDRPLETGYYVLLGVAPNSSTTTDDIKKAYRRLAIKHHPDKNLSDPHAAERFKDISVAYQTLSDPALRKKYNEFGAKASTPEGGFVDPEEVFGSIFGGERFVPIIGNISLAKEMKAAMQEGDDDDDDEGSSPPVAPGGESSSAISGPSGEGSSKRDSIQKGTISEKEKALKEEKARHKAAEKSAARESRISQLTSNLSRKLSIFTESASGPNDRDVTDSWRQICQIEADELKHESFGYELLQTVGFVYVAKAKHFIATNQSFFGVGGWLHNVQGKYHVFSETVSTLRSAIELKSVFDQIQAAEKAGNLSPEEKRKLEEQAAEKGIQALFKGTKLEVESVLRDVCDRVLTDPSLSRDKSLLRAIALQMLGEAYMSVKRDPGSAGMPGLAGILGGMGGSGMNPSASNTNTPTGGGEDSEYVRVETKASKERASHARTTPYSR